MPQRTITHASHDRSRSLGWLAVWWIETFVVHGRGGAVGKPIQYGLETTQFVVDCYAVDANGRRLYDSVFFSRPKGCDKSGIAAALVLFEAFGPARFDGFAEGGESYEFLGETYEYLPGQPMGKQVKNPFIRIMATEEGQVGNVYDNVYYNLSVEGTPLYQLLAYGNDVGTTRVFIHSGGEIRPSTAGAASKDGGLETFAVLDETHLYTTPTLREMAATVRRNLPKRAKTDETWYLETTTMYAPGEESVAEETYEYADQIDQGKARRQRLLFDHRWADVESLSPLMIAPDPQKPNDKRVETDAEYEQRLRDAFVEAYGDAVAWNDPDALLNQLFDTRQSEAETRRYFFNALVEDDNAWVSVAMWNRIGLEAMLAEAKATKTRLQWKPPRHGDTITLGFDGSETGDATVLIACRVSDGYVFPIKIWQAPDTKAGKHWRINKVEVDAAVRKAFEDYNVVGFFADPPRFEDYVDTWEREFGPFLTVSAAHGRAIAFETKQHAQMEKVIERAHTAISDLSIRHGNHKTLTRHVMNARRWKRNSGGYVIGKERHGSPKKMDAAIGLVLAYEACARYRKQFVDEGTSVPVRVR